MVNQNKQTILEDDISAKADEFLKEEKNPIMDEELELPKHQPQPKAVPKQTAPLAKGSILKKMREEKGLTLEMVQEATKIPMDSLRAIEEGYSVRTLSPFYYKGFVKIYCQYLDVDITEVLGSNFKVQESTAELMRKMPIEEINFRSWYDTFLTRQRKRQIVVAVIVIIAAFILFKILFGIGEWMKDQFNKKKPTAVKVEQSRKIDAKVKKNESSDAAIVVVEPPRMKVEEDTAQAQVIDPSMVEVVNTASSTASAAASEAVGKEIMLTVRAKKNSWLRVKTDGDTVFQSTLKQGAVETWAADDNIEISGKNLNQLEVELNGKMLGSLSRNNNQASTVVITKKGLSVIK